MVSSWFLLVTLTAGLMHIPALRAEYLRPATWLRPADATVWYQSTDLTRVNQRLMRQANTARGAWLPPVLWDLRRWIASGTHGWIVTRTEVFETITGARVVDSAKPSVLLRAAAKPLLAPPTGKARRVPPSTPLCGCAGLACPGRQAGCLVAPPEAVAVQGATGVSPWGSTPDGPLVTTIGPNQAVVIVGTGRDRRDREWVHVVSRRVRGWVLADAVARRTMEHAHALDERLKTSAHWLTVIAPEIHLGTTLIADMGTRLRRVPARPHGAPAVQIPIRRPDGTLGWQTHPIAASTIGRDLTHATFYPGIVPPSRANTLRLAWRFLGQPWALGRTDCSGILVQIADAMGLTMVARHSGDQIRQGRRLWSAELGTGTNSELVPVPNSLPHALARLGTDVLLLGKPGHMALYLGERDGAHWVFHAVEGYGVIVSPLSFKQLDQRFTTALTLQ